ncbi:putative spore germination protein GerPB [Siminovitchia terrae]|uniref:Spore germination protein GerPB n=1 Tax=Siminovitchia terrae TaxID=1914933 RepID=A0A429X8B3_SIMTE|nr:spore germination protein GerPB [Siminovitchia terrae]RST59622.1 spore gernimation protein [Siminovitchia terrae]GIN89942.1 putative spore germination protein GerPB [Siminovitchia terrae]GIN97779.1 putative spore germination protein GerPB [Siminovitchia terrae]
MIVNVQQTIHIQMIKIGGITNSSVLQIGTSGVITPSSHLYNTGGYTAPAPAVTGEAELAQQEVSLIPL